MIRVLLVDDHPVVRAGLSALLANHQGIVVVAEAASAAGAMEALGWTQPDVVVLDNQLPDVDGIELLPQIRETMPSAQVVMVTATSDPVVLAGQAAARGAFATLAKTSSRAQLCRTVLAAAGRRVASHADLVTPLTGREREALHLLALHYENREIAEQLCVSADTVKSHVASIMRKLGVQRRGDAVRKAIQLGLIAFPSPEAA